MNKIVGYALAVIALLGLLTYSLIQLHTSVEAGGYAKAEAKFVKENNEALEAKQQELEAVLQRNVIIQREYNEAITKHNAAADRWAATDRGLRQQISGYQGRIRSSQSEAVSAATQGLTDLYTECRAEYRKLGQEAAGLAAAVSALIKSNEQE